MLLLLLPLLAPPASANGQTTHCWITGQAIGLLPSGDLARLMSDPDMELYWRNGSMFPDGGYANGDGYAELAHWEPFQMAYLGWIAETYEPPYEGDAARHVAFLMGLASHGMADQTFDAMYMSRAWHYDAESDWSNSMDEATDPLSRGACALFVLDVTCSTSASLSTFL